MADGFERLAQLKSEMLGSIGEPVPTALPDARIRLQDAKRKYNLSQGETSSPASAMYRSGVARFLDTTLGIPNTLAIAADKMRGDMPRNAGDNLGQSFSTLPQKRSDWGDRLVPTANSTDVFGAAQNLGESAAAFVTGDPNQFTEDPQNEQALLTEQARAEHPVASGAGNVVADAALLASGRTPFVRQKALLQKNPLMSGITARASTTSNPALSAFDEIDQITKFLGKTVKDSNFAQWAAKSGLRVGEAGLEGYALSALTGSENPEETGMFAAGMQAAGSGTLGILSASLGSKPTLARAAGAALIGAAAFQYADTILPGGDDYILPNIESGFNKVAAVAALGAMFAASGYSRVSPNSDLAKRLPALADAITSVPRGSVVGVYNAMKQDPDSRIVMQQFIENPDYFGGEAKNKLTEAIENEKISVVETVDDLMGSKQFRQRFNDIE